MSVKSIKNSFTRLLPILAVLLAFFILAAFSAPAMEGARRGLDTCISVIVPSLLPFFTLSYLLSGLGGPLLLGQKAAPLMSTLFGVSGSGAAAFFLGLSGGYPLGAATVCDLYRRGAVGKKEAEHLLGFCNNSGPAFILGAAGTGIFGSAKIGLLLYGAHVMAAFLVGIAQRGTNPRQGEDRALPPPGTNPRQGGDHALPPPFKRGLTKPFSQAFPDAVWMAVRACAVICGLVVFFSAVIGLLPALEPGWAQSLLTGILELGSGVSSLRGLPATPLNLALCSFLLGFGGLCVHGQTLALCSRAGLKCGRHFAGKLAHGVLSAAIVAGIIIVR